MNAFDSSDSNQPNREELLQMAVNTAKSGNKDGARVMLRQVLNQDKRNERAMLWMAQIARSKSERKKWLQRVVDVNPDNETAQKALKKMAYRSSVRENRILIIFGMIAGVLFLLLIVVLVVLPLLSG